MSIPDWWEFLLLALAAWRVFHLIGHDDILDRPRRYVTRAGKAYRDDNGDWHNIPKEYRENLAMFLECPYCAGFWMVLVWWAAWLVFPTETVFVAVPFALNAAVVGAHKFLSSD